MRADFKLGTSGVIFNKNGEVLLCHRLDHDLWNLPGGGVEKNETPWDGVLREIKEETGLEAKIIKFIGVYGKKDKDELVFSFECEVLGGEITLNDEADKIEYFSPNKLPPNTVPKQVERIRDALEKHSEVLLKVQDGKSVADFLKENNL